MGMGTIKTSCLEHVASSLPMLVILIPDAKARGHPEQLT